MKKNLVFLALLMMVLASALSGCVLAVGNTEGLKDRSPTLGQQLTDLKNACDSGAMTEEEYLEQKELLLKRYNKR